MKTDYWHALDKQTAQNLDVNPKIIGISHGIGDVAKGLAANVFAGASTVELGFMGVGKGSRSTPTGVTPELFGKTEREDMRNMAKINDITVSTHATANVQGFAGLDKDGFKEEKRQEALHEIERTIDFAADVAGGGPVVVHAGEFPRPIMEAERAFEAYPEEKEKRIHYLVDNITGGIIKTVREDEVIFEPEPMRDKKGNIIYQTMPDGKPKIVLGKKVPEYALDDYGDIQMREFSFAQFRDRLKKEGLTPKQIEEKAPKLFFEIQQRAEMEHALGQAEQFEPAYKEGMQQKERLETIREQYNIAKTQEERERLLVDAARTVRAPPPEQPSQIADWFKDSIRAAEKQMAYGREISASARMQARQKEEIIKRATPIKEYAIDKSTETLAKAAITAYDREKAQKLGKTLFIAPENIFPESYGAHPKELKNLIVKSRKEMAEKLTKPFEGKLPNPYYRKGISKTKAKKIADEHIKATFDIGHANTWKKYFVKKQGETIAQHDKRFKKWMKDQVKALQKEKIIGHVHLSDNFGYYDEHVTPGEGTAPIKEFVEQLEKEKFKGAMVVEPGGQPEGQTFQALKGAWRTLSSPAYRLDTAGMTWTDVDQSYFGRTGSPTYVVGDYAPSKDWTLWSETPLE